MKRLRSLLSLTTLVGGMAVASSAVGLSTPTPPDPMKSGNFSCNIQARDGGKFAISGVMGNWTPPDWTNTTLAHVDLKAPDATHLSGRYDVTVKPESIEFFARIFRTPEDQNVNVRLDGVLTILGDTGMITLVQRRINDGKIDRAYIGFCDIDLSAELKELPQ